MLDGIENMNFQEALIDLAEKTGGTSILNTANFDYALAGMAEVFDTFYSLGFQPLDAGKGNYHHIEVRVKRPQLNIRHRSGFLDKPMAQRIADRTLASLIVDFDQNPLDVRLELAPAQKQSSKKYRLPLTVHVPVSELTLLPAEDSQEGRLRLYVVARDGDGDTSSVREIPFPVSIPNAEIDEARQRTVGFDTEVYVGPGHQTIAVGVFDEHSGSESFAHESVDIGSKKSKKIARSR